MAGVYREMPDVLGESERESAAISDFGRWRDRTRARVLLVFALVALVPAGLGYWFVQELQFARNDGRALMIVNVAGAALAFGLVFGIGVQVARSVVRRRTPAKLADLATSYELERERLAQIADLVEKL